ncbi:MAG: DinB family protein [Planctomycetes bacterium]|nr:DinB family protein [Planctomycetota bacterium]
MSTMTDISKSSSYQDKLMGLLGVRDPIDALSKTADVLADMVRANTVADLQARPFPGKWTPTEIIGHLIDSEWVYGFRVRLIFSEVEPTIIGMDQDLWVSAQRYSLRDPRELVEQFRPLRQVNIGLWRAMSPMDLNRCGVHNERGRESLGTMLKMHAGHDLSHIDQLTRYIAAVQAAK